MKTNIQILISAIIIFLSSCCCDCEKDKTDPIAAVQKSEEQLFTLLKNGKIEEAFAMHLNNEKYKNIVDGQARSFLEMGSALKSEERKDIKAYNYNVSKRDFLLIDDKNVLETAEAERKLINQQDSIINSRMVTLSILWSKSDSTWKVAYMHSSYKAE